MAFSDFQYPDVLKQLGLTFASASDLFAAVSSVPAGPSLIADLPAFSRLALASGTEKARSEWLIAPVLGDAWARYDGRISLYSGTGFSAEPQAGLSGYVDFLLSRSPQNVSVTPPVVILIEAKNENIAGGLGSAGKCNCHIAAARSSGIVYGYRISLPEKNFIVADALSLWSLLPVIVKRRSRFCTATEFPLGSAPSYSFFVRMMRSLSSLLVKYPPSLVSNNLLF